jgi:hypothetical protein
MRHHSSHAGPRLSFVRRARLAAFAIVVAAAAAVPAATGSSARTEALTVPTVLQAFELRLGDAAPANASFVRTPSFAWNPVRGAARYQFELSTSQTFRAGNAVVWSSNALITPASPVPIALPWTSGRPLYWRVRAFGGKNVSEWSAAATFRLAPDQAPKRVGGGPGYLRWTSVPGVTGYELWFVNLGRVVTTVSPLVDLREYLGDKAPDKVVWRVRAERRLIGSDTRSLRAASFGPWSEAYTSSADVATTGGLKTLSGGSKGKKSLPEHTLMPVFLFPAKSPSSWSHVYVASDPGCKNVVFNSAVVQGSAYAPRSRQVANGSGTTVAPNDGTVLTKDGKVVVPTEASSSAVGGWARVELPSGRYYWTVVPVERRSNGTYHDTMQVAAACQARQGTFVKTSTRPRVGTTKAPYATGLSTLGRLVSADSAPPRFYGFPLVSWTPAAGATRYEVQWSRSENPWRTVGSTRTFSTSASLPLKPGTWWYRVRGYNGSVRGDQSMAWSPPVQLAIATPTFSIVEN